MDAVELNRILLSAPSREARIAWFGALLARETGTAVEIVGGSAVEIYLSSEEYVSEDVDVVGRKGRIAPVLRQWKFRQIVGRSQRVYWFRASIGLVDIVGAGDRSGLPPHEFETPFGPVSVSAVEPLIVRRLMRARRERSDVLFQQAVRLAKGRELDWEYLATMAKFEKSTPYLERLRKLSKAHSDST